MENISILEIEAAINHFSRRYPPVDYKVCDQARTLADVYGLMIYNKAKSIPDSALNSSQADVLRSYRLTLAAPASTRDAVQVAGDDGGSAESEPEPAFPSA